MARRWVAWLLAAGGLATAVGVSCDEATSSVDGGRRGELLAAVGPSVYLPAYTAFGAQAQALASAVAGWDGQPDSAGPAREAFAAAMTAWQGAELYLAGPAGPSLRYVGGLDLRDRIYSWPTTNPCRVDQALASEAYAAPDYLQATLVNGLGLDALGHLLHAEDGGNACPALVTLNSEGEWAALGDDTVFARRAAFAAVLAEGLQADAQALVQAWAAGDYGAALGEARGYDGQRGAVDQVAWGLLYLDRQVKDMKLATPAGISADCAEDACPDAVELAWGDLSLPAVEANLRAGRALFVGEHPGEADQVGFDALLTDEGAGDLATQILGEFDAALEAVAAIEGPLAEAVVERPEQVAAAHARVQALTTSLKTRFITVLNLTLPQEGAADND